MKYKYIIFFQDLNSDIGNSEVTLNNKIKGLSQIKEIEKTIEEEKNIKVIITDFKYVGMSWK